MLHLLLSYQSRIRSGWFFILKLWPCDSRRIHFGCIRQRWITHLKATIVVPKGTHPCFSVHMVFIVRVWSDIFFFSNDEGRKKKGKVDDDDDDDNDDDDDDDDDDDNDTACWWINTPLWFITWKLVMICIKMISKIKTLDLGRNPTFFGHVVL